MVEKKKDDYTNSAVNLCNPPAVGEMLSELSMAKADVLNLQTILEQLEPYKQIREAEKSVSKLTSEIKALVEAHGSYQDIEAGAYAIKQRRLSVTYVVAKVREFIRAYADAVIEEVVSKQKLEGLRTAKLVSQADLDRCAETAETFALIVKVAVPEPQQDAPQPR